MSTSLGKNPKIPRIPKKVPDPRAEPNVEKKKEFSGELEGGTLWQVLRVEENLLRNILLRMSPVDLINFEKTCVLMRDLIVQNKVWKNKLLSDFRHLLANKEVTAKLELVVTEADEKYDGDVVKDENWSYKLQYVHCWNLQLNWDKGQFLQSETVRPQPLQSSENNWVSILNSTDFSVIGERPAGLFCHKNKTLLDLGFDHIWSVIEVLPKILVIFGSPCIKLVEKNSLKVLAECECDKLFLGPSLIGDKVVFYGYDGEAHVFNFQDDPPCIGQVKFDLVEHQLLSLPSEFFDDDYQSLVELSGQFCVDNAQYKLDLYKADFANVANEKKLYQKVWSLDISNQSSFPKVEFISAMIDFPFMYVGKTNGALEVWDVTKDKLVKTVDQTGLVNARTQVNSIVKIQQNDIGKVCVRNKYNDIFVMNANLFKSDADSQLGYRLNYDEVGHTEMEVDSTCIVVDKVRSFIKFDFWPIFPANFNLKLAKPEVVKETLVKAKQRSDHKCSSGYHGLGKVKKQRIGDESEDSDREDDDDCNLNEI